MSKAKLINHTNLSPTASALAIKRLCLDAREKGFGSVCVLPVMVALAAEELFASDVQVATVIGFPLGGNTKEVKLAEAKQALTDGAMVLEVVFNFAKFKSGEIAYVQEELTNIVELAQGLQVKVIVDSAYLNQEELMQAYQIVEASGAKVIKTATGFSRNYANIEDIAFINQVAPSLKIEACGGIALMETMEVLLNAGADYIATSAGLAIMQEYQDRGLE